jgi:putative ABC transport system ATP-binding protein
MESKRNASEGDGSLYVLQNVGLEAGGSHILNDVSQRLNRGHVYLIAGPSGSGKTSLLRLLNGLAFPTQGSILFDGRNIQEYNLPELRSRVSLLTQQATLVNGTVLDNLALPFKFAANRQRRFDHGIAQEALHRVGLSHSFLERATERLSGGEKQRVALARALLLEPDVLLADEPTSSLDLSSEERIVNLLSELKGEKTVIAVSHSTRFLSFADEILLMSKGAITETRDSMDIAEFKEFLDIEEESADG